MSSAKRVEEARESFARGDLAAAARAHDLYRIVETAEEKHGGIGSQYLGDMVYGGLDGIITTFAVVSGVAGAALGTPVILILGLANLLADGFAMATGSYLSLRSEKEYYQREEQREAWEAEHFPEGEKAELLQAYSQRGYPEEDALRLVEIQTRDKKLWVRAMMVEELGMLEDERKPVLRGLATFSAFVTAGSLPLLIYFAGLFFPVPSGIAFPVSIFLSGLALFLLGASKVLVTKLNPLRSGIEMLLVGSLAGVVAYTIGTLLKGLAAGVP